MFLSAILVFLATTTLYVLPVNAACNSATGKHNFSKWRTEKKATIFETGISIRECEKCLKIELKTIPKKKATKNEKAAIKTVNTFYSAAQKYNTQKMGSTLSKKTKLSVLVDKNLINYVRSKNKKLKYKITGIKQSGKKATVTVECDYISAYFPFYKALVDLTLYCENHPNISNSARLKYFYQRILKYDNKKSNSLYSERDKVKIKLVKEKGKWKIDKPSKKVMDIIHCQYESAYRDWLNGC